MMFVCRKSCRTNQSNTAHNKQMNGIRRTQGNMGKHPVWFCLCFHKKVSTTCCMFLLCAIRLPQIPLNPCYERDPQSTEATKKAGRDISTLENSLADIVGINLRLITACHSLSQLVTWILHAIMAGLPF